MAPGRLFRAPGRLLRLPGRLFRLPGRLFRARSGRFSGHKVADIWTQGAQYYEHLHAFITSMGGPYEATKVLLNLFDQGPSALRKHFFREDGLLRGS